MISNCGCKSFRNLAGAILAATLLLAPQASAQITSCGAEIQPTVLSSAPFFVGDTITFNIEVGVGVIQGGTFIDVDDVRRALDCDVDLTPAMRTVDNCVDDTMIAQYVGDATIMTDCVDIANDDGSGGGIANNQICDGTETCVSWSSGNADNSFAPNVVVLTPDALTLPANTSCNVSFDFVIADTSSDSTPFGLEGASQVNGTCDNTETGSANGSTTIPVSLCEVTLDKRVSCDNGISYRDVTGDDDADGTAIEGCVGWEDPAEPVLGQWVINNTGNVPLYNCELTDTNSLLLGSQPVLLDDPIAVSGMQTVDDSGMCTSAFDDLEPNTATVQCACEDEPLVDADPTTTASDTADVVCQDPDLSMTKVCDPATAGGISDVTITATNTGEAPLENCVLVDRIAVDSETCPADASSGTNVPVTPDMFDLLTPGVSQQMSTGMTPAITSNSCNKAFLTCEVQGAQQEVLGDAIGDDDGACEPNEDCEPKTIMVMDDDLCEVQGDECLTRTPGFWGTHPHITELFLPLDNCGVTINNVVDSSQGSAIEDMCSVGRDPKINSVFDQQVQLERQCMAAFLNVAATADEFQGSCETAFPGTSDLIAECCTDTGSICQSELEPGEEGVNMRTIESCISGLDAFNNNDTAEPDPMGSVFESPGPADPSECKDSKNNGFLNDRDRADTGKPCRGKGCP